MAELTIEPRGYQSLLITTSRGEVIELSPTDAKQLSKIIVSFLEGKPLRRTRLKTRN
jgi:hypothetical protein